jgi:hypothetical protein
MTTKITLNNITDTALATLTGPKVTTIVYPGDDTATDTAGGATINLTGNGFQSGCSVLVASTASSVVTFISATQISFIAPALAAGTYVVYVINPDGGTAISIPGISYSGTPNWSTAAGSLGTAYETGSISSTLTATGDNPITYTLASGTLPPGSTLNSNGTLSGTAQATASATTYTFTISANDAQNQTTNRSFSITINPDVVTWSSPADSTTYTVTKDSAISNVALSATSAAGGSVTYTSDALPTGLSISGANITGTPTVTANTTTVLTATSTATRTATRTINWVVSVANDPFFKNTTLLLSGTANTFVKDASTNNFAVSVVGDTRPNNFGPYTPGYYSNYFDGTGDYLTLPTDSNIFNFGTTDFTIEAWIYPTALSGYQQIAGATYSASGAALYLNGTTLTLYTTGAQATLNKTPDGSILQNAWQHVAAVRASGILKLYINGIERSSVAYTTNLTTTDAEIGRRTGINSEFYFGYISNLRVVKGTAVYTSAFTPSTVPLTAIAGTSLLTCQSNRFIDNSTNNFAVTRNGDTRIDGFDPFVPSTEFVGRGSTYFDGTGDYLTVPSNAAFGFGTEDFTIEFWTYPTVNARQDWVDITNGSNRALLYYSGSAIVFFSAPPNAAVITGPAMTLNVWQHIAVSKQSGSTRLFVNGVQVGATYTTNIDFSAANSVTIGKDSAGSTHSTGYISNIRVVKGTAVYTANFTPPVAPLTAVVGTSLLTCQTNQPANNNVFLDSSTNNFLITRNGNTTQGAFSPYGGGWSNYFDGGTNRLTTAGSSVFNLSGTSFTLECWVYMTAAPSVLNRLITIGPNNTQSSFTLAISTSRVFDFSVPFGSGGGVGSGANSIPLNTWTHLAFTLSGSTGTIYLNGTQVGQSTGWNITSSNSNYFYIGYDTTATVDGKFTGYVSNVRLVKGTAVYAANFTPSTAPLQPISGTAFLTCADNRFIDDSINNFAITTVGAVSVQKFNPFGIQTAMTPQSHSAFFDGTGDYLTLSAAPVAATGTFTIECWVYVTGTAASQSIYGQYLGGGSAAPGRWSIFWNDTANKFSFSIATTDYTSASTYSANTWYHVAWVRDGSNNLSLYVNGVRDSTTAGVSASLYTGNPIIGARNDGTTPYTGYISNFRVTNTVVYSGTTYTVPTSQLTAIAGTTVLTCQGPTFVDNSTNRFAITAAGDARPSQTNPFGYTAGTTTSYTPAVFGGSVYFDGAGDSLDLPSSTQFVLGNATKFTIEAWIYPRGYNQGGSGPPDRAAIWSCGIAESGNPKPELSITTAGKIRFGGWNAAAALGATTVPLNTWSHVAATFDGTTYRVFYNGVLDGSGTTIFNFSTTPVAVAIGSNPDTTYRYPYLGYISNLRILKGTALYTSNFVPPIAPLVPILNTALLMDGTSASITDASTSNNLETLGDARISTVQSKFGGSSMFFDGTDDRLAVPSTTALQFGTGDFTIEFWLYSLDSADRYVFSIGLWGGTTGVGMIQYQGNYAYGSGANWPSNAGQAITPNVWRHIAITRTGGNIRFFFDGVLKNTSTDSNNLTLNTLSIGSGNIWGNYFGYMQDFRITRGVARYTANFTPPTTAFIAT